jgi:hypothetical protein
MAAVTLKYDQWLSINYADINNRIVKSQELFRERWNITTSPIELCQIIGSCYKLTNIGYQQFTKERRLIACNFARQYWDQVSDAGSESIICGEKMVDPTASIDKATIKEVNKKARNVRRSYSAGHTNSQETNGRQYAIEGLACICSNSSEINLLAKALDWSEKLPNNTQCAIIRDMVANPFAKTTLQVNYITPQIKGLAIGASQANEYGQLDNHRVAIIADALEDNGCTEEALLNHLRTGNHWHGCYAIDLLLSK